MPRSLGQLHKANVRLSNEPCGIPHCTHKRMGVARYCRRHVNAAYLYGHPLGSPLPRSNYRDELDEVASLFNDNSNHAGLQSVLKYLDGWIDEASRGEAVVGNYILGRIHIKRIQGRVSLSAVNILTEIIAIWVFSQRYPNRLPDDQRLTFALSRSLCHMATLEKRTYGQHKRSRQPPLAELRGVGERIRQTLALFLINVVASLKAKADKAKESREAMSIPFE